MPRISPFWGRLPDAAFLPRIKSTLLLLPLQLYAPRRPTMLSFMGYICMAGVRDVHMMLGYAILISLLTTLFFSQLSFSVSMCACALVRFLNIALVGAWAE
jgi:hypothetical protein